ncbi:MAG: transcriptional regulator [Candidatus Woesearchaeota archaeon]
MTTRKEMIELLGKNRMSIRELALYFRITTDEAAIDLRHIAKSIYPKQQLKMELPLCKSCGFEFKDRTKLRPPTKCPKCRHEKITEPKFWIEGQKI